VKNKSVDVNNTDDLSAYVDQLEKEIRNQNNEKPNYNFKNYADINKYWDVEILEVIDRFPKEWTVVQFCKNFNVNALTSKYEDIVSYNTGILLTIFKHSALKDLQPLMIEILKPSHIENIFEKVYKLNKKILDNLNYGKKEQDNAERREKYWMASKELDNYVQVCIGISLFLNVILI
jgi:hypothetical protein